MSETLNDGWTPVDDEWTPVMHEDAPAREAGAEPEKAEPKAAEKPKGKTEDKPGMVMSLPVSVMVPPAVLASIADLSESQAALTEVVGQTNDMLERVVSSFEGACKSMADSAIDMGEYQRQAGDDVQAMMRTQAARMDALMKSIEGLGQRMIAVEAAVTAPRRVVLERDKDGFATSAVSKVAP